MNQIKFKNILVNIILNTTMIGVICGNDIYTIIQNQLIMAQPGDVITLPDGKHYIERSLWGDNLNKVRIQGGGIDKTILSFSKQIEGAEGIKITNSKYVTLSDFTIEDSKGDLIKVEDTNDIKFNRIKVQWTGGPKETNGSYGLYPVKCDNVFIDKCIAIGASDAGIYVGQSKNVVVKNSEAYHNVAGIEIENTVNAIVYNNYTHNNTGGILVFDLPDLLVKKGGNVKVYNNLVVENNHSNFAPEGNIVAKVPSGTGVMVLATSDVEIYDNIIFNNKTANTSIVSYYITEEELTDSLYYPYPGNIYIHDNIYRRDKQFPSLSFTLPIGLILAYNFWRDVPDIIYDGILDENITANQNESENLHNICIKDNINASFVNLDAANDFTNMSTNQSQYTCEINYSDK